jgi:hypothetical protein
MGVSQTAFREALLDPARAVPDGLTDPAGRPAGKRFDVYRNNVVASLSDALATGFPVVARLLGPENFRALAVAYSRAHPPRTPLMMHMGGDLPGFLEGFAPLARHGYLPDIARLELALRESYHAADAAPVMPDAFATLDAAALAGTRLRFAPAMRLVTSRWPIVQIWRFNMEGGPQPQPGPEAALVTRPAFDPRIDALSPGGAVLVSGLRSGAPLGPAAEAAAGAEPDFEPQVTLGALFAGHAIAALLPPDPIQGLTQ